MNAAEKLYEEYQEKLRRLQQECPHSEQTDWMEEWWASGRLCTFFNPLHEYARACTAIGVAAQARAYFRPLT